MPTIASRRIHGIPMRICTRCIFDETTPRIRFNADGVCNYCDLHDELELAYPQGPEGERRLERMISEIKRQGRGKKYDCIVGISGGRDSTYTLHLAKEFGLRPLAVHFNDGFGNPVAGENMVKLVKRLGVELRTISSDWREGKDLRIALLKASVPDVELSNDLGLAAALYASAVREKVKFVIIGQSFRTEGVSPLEWFCLDGTYLSAVHKQFGSVPLRPWKPTDPGFHLGIREMAYYVILKRIRTISLPYYVPYHRPTIDKLIKERYEWVNTGAHYFDNLYQSLMTHILRRKFNIDRRRMNYSALVRSGEMTRGEALEKISKPSPIEDEDVIRLCIKRLGLTEAEFGELLAAPPKSFHDYPNSIDFLQKWKYPVKKLAEFNLIPMTSYKKYFELG